MSQPVKPLKLRHPINDFIVEHLPEWLTKASPQQIAALRACYKPYLASQKQLAEMTRKLQPLDKFATARLQRAFAEDTELQLDVDLATLIWREQRARLNTQPGAVPDYQPYYVRVPALQKLLQNFKDGESYYLGTALISQALPGGADTLVSDDVDRIVKVCRRADVGAAYQQHLAEVLSAAFETKLVTDKRLELTVAVETAAIKGQLGSDDVEVLRQLCKGETLAAPGVLRFRLAALQVLGCRVDGAFCLEWLQPPRNFVTYPFGGFERLQKVILYFPDAPARPLRVFSDWGEMDRALASLLASDDQQRALRRRIALDDQASFRQTLDTRLRDAQPDLEPRRVRDTEDVFVSLAAWHLQRIKADARFLAVTTAQADANAAAMRLKALETAGLVLLNVAGLFVPAIGALLLADFGRQLLGAVCEGVRDWQLGHQHEALQHLLQLAQAVSSAGAVVIGAHLLRNAFMETLEPVLTSAGRVRLWRNDLTPYTATRIPTQALALDNGLLSDGQRYWCKLGDVAYRLRRDTSKVWRLLHRDGEASYGPALEHNNEAAWRLGAERPLEWQGAALLLGRLWPAAVALDEERVAEILRVADVDEAYLRGLLVENRRMPVNLRDTLERFAVQARLDRFFADLGTDTELFQWCTDRLRLQGEPFDQQRTLIGQQATSLRAPLLEHFSQAYLGDDPLLALIKRDFASLPDAYAHDVLATASQAMRVRMAIEQRLPLAMAERARATLQLARLTRAREGLYLQDSYRDDVVALVFALLRRHGPGTAQTNLLLRESPLTGPVKAQWLSQATEAQLMLVRRDGRFQLYDDRGLAHEREPAEPEGLFEALVAGLPADYCRRQGWSAAEGPARLRRQLQAWLPEDSKGQLNVLGWTPARPKASPMRRLPDGRLGYSLGGCQSCSLTPRRRIRNRVRALFPAMDDAAAEQYLHNMLQRPGTLLDNLMRVEQEYRQLDNSLRAWSDAGLADARRTRQRIEDALRRAWQMREARPAGALGRRAALSLSMEGVAVGELPVLPPGTDFSHISELRLSALNLSAIPQGFLASFPRLRRLDLSDNNLTELPHGLEDLTGLRQLLMSGNQITIPPSQAQVLSRLPQLQSLDLSDNPLRTISLQFNQLSSLRILRLSRTQLRTLPAGLEWCGLLLFADLRHNQISGFPRVLFQAPLQVRRALHLEGNSLTVEDLHRLYGVERLLFNGAQVSADPVLQTWLRSVAQPQRQMHQALWDGLRAEPRSDSFFNLLGRLIDTAEFRRAPEQVSARVWAIIEAASRHTATRDAVFELAAEPPTCVDSVSTVFSRVEVRMQVEEATHGGAPLATRSARLQLARRLFRVAWVERIARRDMDARYADGRWRRGERSEEEVEVNLAYLSGLAERLNLLGQPRHMQFAVLAQVTQEQLDAAYLEVLDAEATDQRLAFISERDFWLDVLRAEQPTRFDDVESRFARQLETLDEQRLSLTSDDYVSRANAIRDGRETALTLLAQELTLVALQAPESP
ncbi:NEL-type E3 ubiquitin ligase domain-containing protein [Pseudomonas sp. NPDC089408]|uniref:NEL-type E3 ubiquitin ligase domain-containing protein n=1 Tax=Pseudomonas sp. NPDC089408 TaxID=3364465 RepID=UPI003828457A